MKQNVWSKRQELEVACCISSESDAGHREREVNKQVLWNLWKRTRIALPSSLFSNQLCCARKSKTGNRKHKRTKQIMGQEEWEKEWLKITSKRTKTDKERLRRERLKKFHHLVFLCRFFFSWDRPSVITFFSISAVILAFCSHPPLISERHRCF